METNTATYALNHVMLRVKNPAKSVEFYTKVLGMTLVDKIEMADRKATLYFLAYGNQHEEMAKKLDPSKNRLNRAVFTREGILELTHNWGTEDDENFSYHNGNQEPKGFGHIAITVDNMQAACNRFEQLNVHFVKKLNEGKQENLAMIADPDGYWVAVLANPALA